MSGKKLFATAETLAGTRTLTTAEIGNYFGWRLDPGGAGRSLVMPSESANVGHEVFVANAADAAEDITVKASDTSTTVGVISQDECALIRSDGVKWWVSVGKNT